MNILNQVLTNLPIRKTQSAYLNLLCALILAIPGRINYANLERFSNHSEKTFRNWAEKPIEWVRIAVGVVQTLQAHKRMGSRFILGTDCTALRKAGKHTPGIAKFWDSIVRNIFSSCVHDVNDVFSSWQQLTQGQGFR